MPIARLATRAIEAFSHAASALTLALLLLDVPALAGNFERDPPADYPRVTAPVTITLGIPEFRAQRRGLLETRPAGFPAGTGEAEPVATTSAPTDDHAQFVAVVLADTEDTWARLFVPMGVIYREPILVLYIGQIISACGLVSTATGPLYCSRDEKMYFDLSFFERANDGAGTTDMALAFAVARAVGHHVQNLLGVPAKVDAARIGASDVESNRLSLMLEFQADCFAGVWAHDANARKLLEVGDIDALVKAAAGIGAGESSDERANWFLRGYDQGSLDYCKTIDPGR